MSPGPDGRTSLRLLEARARDRRIVTIELAVTVAEARDGAVRRLAYERLVVCAACHGTGRDPSSPPCSACGGLAAEASATIDPQACSRCGGRGHDQRYDCAACDRGYACRTAGVEVTLPRGVDDGAELRFAGRGHESVGGGSGDLFVTVVVESVRPTSPYRGPLR